MARVIRCFHIVGDDFPEYVLAGIEMSMSWRCQRKMPEFYVISRGFFNFHTYCLSFCVYYSSSCIFFLSFLLFPFFREESGND